MKTIPKGTEFPHPHKPGGYRVIRDINPGDPVEASSIEPFGQVDAPIVGGVIPEWFHEQARKRFDAYAYTGHLNG